MWGYVGRRLALAIPTLLGASIIVFAMVHLAPGDPIAAVLPVDASKEQVELVKQAYGFDKPLPVQYLKWLARVAQGDLGKSIATRRAVILDVRDALANSLVLALSSSLLAFVLGIALGLLAAFCQGRWVDKASSALAVIGVSVPHYWAGIILIIIFSVQLNWLPAMGAADDPGILPYLRHITLPTLALALIPLGVITRVVRSAALDVLNQEFVLALRAKGLVSRRVFTHVVKNAAPQILRARLAVRLSARRLGAGGGRVLVAGHRLSAEPRHLSARHPRAAGRDPRALDVLRAAQPRGRLAADAGRPADRAPLMAVTTALPRDLDAVTGAPMSYWRTVGWRLARDPATIVAGSLLVLIALSALLAPWLAPYDPNAGSIRLRLAPVGAPAHVLGTDEQGRDMLSRLLWGGRMTLVAGLTPVLVAFVLGSGLGVLAGYLGGLTNMLIMRTMDIFYAFPAVLLAIAISGALGPGLANTVIALSIVFVPRVVRVAESATVQVQGLEYIAAARASGAGVAAIVRHHLLANVLGPILVFSSTQVSLSIILAAGLSFLGLGVTPPAAEWGLMLNTLRQSIYVNALVPALPGLAIFITSMAFNLFSDGLRDAMEIRA